MKYDLTENPPSNYQTENPPSKCKTENPPSNYKNIPSENKTICSNSKKICSNYSTLDFSKYTHLFDKEWFNRKYSEHVVDALEHEKHKKLIYLIKKQNESIRAMTEAIDDAIAKLYSLPYYKCSKYSDKPNDEPSSNP